MVHPEARLGSPPSGDMPPAVVDLYDEARDIAARSPRAAVGLLRLGLQVLVDDLVPGSKNVFDKIGDLVRDGLAPRVQRAADTLRVAGNNGVHPGSIQLHDDPGTLEFLFALLNLIVAEVITRPREIDELYVQLPAGALAAIERRDGPLVNAEEAAEEDAAPTGEPNAGSVDSTVSAPN